MQSILTSVPPVKLSSRITSNELQAFFYTSVKDAYCLCCILSIPDSKSGLFVCVTEADTLLGSTLQPKSAWFDLFRLFSTISTIVSIATRQSSKVPPRFWRHNVMILKYFSTFSKQTDSNLNAVVSFTPIDAFSWSAAYISSFHVWFNRDNILHWPVHLV